MIYMAEVRYFHQPWARPEGNAPMTDGPAPAADYGCHKIVEHAIGAGRFCACKCLCGWTATASSLERLDDLAELHIDGSPAGPVTDALPSELSVTAGDAPGPAGAHSDGPIAGGSMEE